MKTQTHCARSIRTAGAALTLGLALVPAVSLAQAPVILSLNRNGELTWSCPEPGRTYRVLWAPRVTGPWSASWEALSQVAPGAATNTTVDVPMFFRVVTPSVTPSIDLLSAAQAGQMIQTNLSNPNLVILDVRTASEYGSGRIKDAVNIDFYGPTFGAVIDLLPRNRLYVVYCRSGGRSASVVAQMSTLGFETVHEIGGGFTAFAAEPANAPLIE